MPQIEALCAQKIGKPPSAEPFKGVRFGADSCADIFGHWRNSDTSPKTFLSAYCFLWTAFLNLGGKQKKKKAGNQIKKKHTKLQLLHIYFENQCLRKTWA